MYKPLPDCLTIKNSGIHGLGLFASKNINKYTNLGISHYYYNDSIHRTPLGGFYNHSNNPNCEKEIVDNKYFLKAIKDIKEDEEITVKYTLYNL